jgi:hypothetical protein
LLFIILTGNKTAQIPHLVVSRFSACEDKK